MRSLHQDPEKLKTLERRLTVLLLFSAYTCLEEAVAGLARCKSGGGCCGHEKVAVERARHTER